MLPQLVRMIVQPETLLRLPHLSTWYAARPGNAQILFLENSLGAPLFDRGFGGRLCLPKRRLCFNCLFAPGSRLTLGHADGAADLVGAAQSSVTVVDLGAAAGLKKERAKARTGSGTDRNPTRSAAHVILAM
jgi:non-ribosomal peptide synthetase component F